MAAGPRRDADDGVSTVDDIATAPMTNRVSRRGLLSAAAVGSTAALAGCAEVFGSETASGEAALDVCVWSGNYYDRFEESVVPMYEDEYGVDVRLHGGWNDILVDIRQSSGDPPYDVTVADGYFYHVGRQEGLFEPIREENVPNLESVIDHYAEFRTTEYGVPVDGAPCTIIYREDLETEPETWADLGSSLDDVGITLSHADDITAYEATRPSWKPATL